MKPRSKPDRRAPRRRLCSSPGRRRPVRAPSLARAVRSLAHPRKRPHSRVCSSKSHTTPTRSPPWRSRSRLRSARTPNSRRRRPRSTSPSPRPPVRPLSALARAQAPARTPSTTQRPQFHSSPAHPTLHRYRRRICSRKARAPRARPPRAVCPRRRTLGSRA